MPFLETSAALTTTAVARLLALAFDTQNCSAARAAHAEQGTKAQHGSVLVEVGSAKAAVAGPIAIHAYSEFSGAKLFIVPAVSGTDRDCTMGASLGMIVAADKVATLTVRAGQLACVSTTSARATELLWHARKGDTSSAHVLLASRH